MPSGGLAALPGRVLQETNQGITVVDPDEKIALLIMAEFYALSEEIGPELWPEWSAEKIRYALRVGPDRWFLVNHQDPPPGMIWVLQQTVSAPVYCGPLGMDPEGHGNIPVRGKMTGVLPVEPGRIALFCEETVGLLFQLSAQQIMGIVCSMKQGIRLSDPQLTTPSVEARALRRAEMKLLTRALTVVNDSLRLQEIARFKAVRNARRKAVDPNRYAFELHMEATEGMALYLRLRAMELACAHAREGRLSLLDDKTAGFNNFAMYDGILHAHCVQKLRETTAQGYTGGIAEFHVSGMALAGLLDVLSPGWKERLMDSPEETMETILFDSVETMDSVSHEQWLEEALEICEYPRLLEEERLTIR